MSQKNDGLRLINFNHSLKNIPLCDKKSYLMKLFNQTSNFVNRLRWKVFYFELRNSSDAPHPETQNKLSKIYSSRKSAPEMKKLKAFEDDLFNMIKNIKFSTFKSNYQQKLSRDLKELLSKKMVIVKSDKTSNLYYATPQLYKKLMINSLTSEYSISPNDPTTKMNNDASLFLSHNNISNRKVPKFQKAEAFITIKDHKPNFPHSIKCRMINPAKSFLGKCTKVILQEHIAEIRSKTELTQWINSDSVIEWFNKIEDKPHKCFINFDIKNFYPSITKDHLLNAIEFGKKFTKFSNDEIDLLMHTCQTIVCYDNRIWTKLNNNDNFDIAMGSFHGAEVCDLVGLFILSKITPVVGPLNIGLYRDDGLGIIKQSSGSNLEKLKKSIINEMSKIGFEITIEIGETSIDFLDISLDLTCDKFCPYKKPNSKTCYINNGSNHPKQIRENIPKMIEQRLSKLSKNKNIFDNIKGTYQNALNKSNFKYKLKYRETINHNKKKTRKRKCLYYNPPFCKSVQTNIGKLFLALLDKHFGKSSEYHKIINRNCVKLSYCCSPNILALINGHNRRLTSHTEEKNEKLCNCKSTNNCPVQNKCCLRRVVYQANITTANNESKIYIGSTKRMFKARFNEHKASFPKNKISNKPKNCTQLSNYLWMLKEKKIMYSIEWEIIDFVKSNNTNTNMCKLCNLERFYIAKADKRKILNKRNELVTQCPHYLCNFL